MLMVFHVAEVRGRRWAFRAGGTDNLRLPGY